MDSESESVKSHTESEEDDFGCYFLQPSSSPYNIVEKVHQANVDLFNAQQNQVAAKTAKVKFREELISFEPDLTDDDVNSLESDRTDPPVDAGPQVIEFKTSINNQNLRIFNIMEDVEEVIEVLEEEVLEEVDSDTEYKPEVKVRSAAEATIDEEASASERKEPAKRKKKSKCRTAFLNPHEVICKDHCIDRLDHELCTSLRKLEIQEKVELPPLQLLQRKCCDEVKKKLHPNLPQYNGLRSEYGLSSRQLERREKQKELQKMREQMRHQLFEEYRIRKMQQNEKVFCQWLREVSKRKPEKKSTKKRASSAKQSSTANKTDKKIMERAKTANAFIPRTKTKKKRRPPYTNIYIEVPTSCLENQLRIGDLTVTNSKLLSRNLHIIKIS